MIWFLYLPLALLLYVAVWHQHTHQNTQASLYAALVRTYPNPNISRRTTPMTTTSGYKPELELDTVEDPLIGELEDRPHVDDIPEAPILASDTLDDGFNVYIDVGLAMTPNGHHAIKVAMHGNGTLTAAQANRLHNVLDLASRVVAGARQDPGYSS